MRKILITGATGFIGKNLLLHFLEKKYFIVAVLKKTKKNIKFSRENNKNKKFKSLLFSNTYELKKKLSNYKIDYVIHAATYYVKKHKFSDIGKIIKSNILFSTIMLDLLCNKRIKKIINFGTVWQHYNNEKERAYNLYASSKQAFNNIFNYYKKQFPEIKFYNLLISDTFGKDDKRKKLIPMILKNYNKKIIENIISKNIKPDTYVIKDKVSLKIFNLINYLNKKLKKKIIVNWSENKFTNEKIINSKVINFNKVNNNKKEILELFNENI